MADVHFMLQGKGGVGKSFISAMFSQWKTTQGQIPLCVDTDPINHTLLGFKKLNVIELDIMTDQNINPRQFDLLVEQISKTTTDIIVDNGASSFVPLCNYMLSNEVSDIIARWNHRVVIHTVISGGFAMLDTINGFDALVRQFPSQTPFIVWLNPYFGMIEDAGRSFTELNAYKSHSSKITGMVQLPNLAKETYGVDIEKMIKARETFEEAQLSKTYKLMTKERLKIFERKLFSAIEVGVADLH
jgi:hypothetical protein